LAPAGIGYLEHRSGASPGRNPVMDFGERVAQLRFLVRDRAGQFAASFDAASFDAVLSDAGIEVVKIRPAVRGRIASPNASS
jgi:hypothetical protein